MMLFFYLKIAPPRMILHLSADLDLLFASPFLNFSLPFFENNTKGFSLGTETMEESKLKEAIQTHLSIVVLNKLHLFFYFFMIDMFFFLRRETKNSIFLNLVD